MFMALNYIKAINEKKSSLCCVTVYCHIIQPDKLLIGIRHPYKLIWLLLKTVFMLSAIWYFDTIFYLRISMHFASVHLIYALQELTTESNIEMKAQVQSEV